MSRRKFPAVFMRATVPWAGEPAGNNSVVRRPAHAVGAAAQIVGNIVQLRLAMQAGAVAVGAKAQHGNAEWQATRGSLCRTARRLFDDCVYA
jgi:2-methylaconitate cis-trans-isomerase PrpF